MNNSIVTYQKDNDDSDSSNNTDNNNVTREYHRQIFVCLRLLRSCRRWLQTVGSYKPSAATVVGERKLSTCQVQVRSYQPSTSGSV